MQFAILPKQAKRPPYLFKNAFSTSPSADTIKNAHLFPDCHQIFLLIKSNLYMIILSYLLPFRAIFMSPIYCLSVCHSIELMESCGKRVIEASERTINLNKQNRIFAIIIIHRYLLITCHCKYIQMSGYITLQTIWKNRATPIFWRVCIVSVPDI